MGSVKSCWSLKQVSKWTSGENLEKWPKMASITLRMAIFSIFGDFLALKPSQFFQMGEISASVWHEARSDKGRMVPATKTAKKYQIWPFCRFLYLIEISLNYILNFFKLQVFLTGTWFLLKILGFTRFLFQNLSNTRFFDYYRFFGNPGIEFNDFKVYKENTYSFFKTEAYIIQI